MSAEYQIDSLDRKILEYLLRDARKPFIEIARELKVSGGTIHQRIDKLEKSGILKGYTAKIDRTKMGFTITAFIGIHLKAAKDSELVLKTLKSFPEVIETHFTSGAYSLMAKVSTTTMQAYYDFLTDKVQMIKEIQSTESFFSLHSPVEREVVIS